jgi:hypothetical protein
MLLGGGGTVPVGVLLARFVLPVVAGRRLGWGLGGTGFGSVGSGRFPVWGDPSIVFGFRFRVCVSW